MSQGATSFQDTAASLSTGAPPFLPLVCQLVVATPIVVLLPPLILLMLHHTLSTDASPQVCLLFAGWLSRCPCCLATAYSCSLNAPPPPHNVPPPLVDFSTRSPLICWLVVTSHLVAPPPPHVIFFCKAASCVHPRPPSFICISWLLCCILLRCLCLPSSCQHRCLLMRHRLTSPR